MFRSQAVGQDEHTSASCFKGGRRRNVGDDQLKISNSKLSPEAVLKARTPPDDNSIVNFCSIRWKIPKSEKTDPFFPGFRFNEK